MKKRSNFIMNMLTKTKLLVLSALTVPFIGLVILLSSSLKDVSYIDHLVYSISLILVCLLSLIVSSFSYKTCHADDGVRIFFISLAFYTFSINFLVHFISSLGFILFNKSLFYTTENFGILLGTLLLLLSFLPNIERNKDFVLKYRLKIFTLWSVGLMSFLGSALSFPQVAQILELTSNIVVIATTAALFALFILSLLWYGEKKNHLALFLYSGFAILFSSEVTSLFYTEWNLMWWYSRFIFVIGIAIILAGFIHEAIKRFETTFKEVSFFSRISTRLSFSIVVLSVIPLVLINNYSFKTYQENLIQQVSSNLEISAESREGQTFSYLESLRDRTVDFSSDGLIVESIKSINSSKMLGIDGREELLRVTRELNNHLVNNKKTADEYIVGIIIVNTDGIVVSATNELEIGRDESKDAYFTESLSGVHYSELSNHLHFGKTNMLAVGSPIKDSRTGNLLGVIVNFFDSSELSNIFSGKFYTHNHELLVSKDLEYGTQVFMVDDEGKMIIMPYSQKHNDIRGIIIDTVPVQKCLTSNQEVVQKYINHEGTEVIGVSRCLPSLGWTLIVEADLDVLLDQITKLKQLLLFIIVIIVALVVFIAIYFSRKLTEPLESLITVSNKISSGDLKVRARVNTTSEIGVLAQSVNKMVEELEKRQKDNLRQEKETQSRNRKLLQLNSSLEDTKRATMNILEDLDEEKRQIEEKIKDRTKELEEEKSKLFHVTANMQTGNIFVDENKKVLFINKAAQDILKVQTNDTASVFSAFGEKFKDVKYDELLNVCTSNTDRQIIPELESDKRIFEIEFSCVNKDSHENVANGMVKYGHYGTFIWIRDITEQKLLERSKSELVAVASHQLRTPLTVARGNIEMLLDGSFGDANEKQKELLTDTEDSVIRLIELVNDMLDITKIEKGDIDLVLSKFNILEPLQVVIDNLGDYAKRHEFDIKIHDSGEGAEVFADSSRLVQIFQNLIDNAIRYGRAPGNVDITFTVKDNMVEVSVGDNGIGIPEMEQANLFGRFYRASNAVKFASGGSGLGLFIVKSLIEQMGGQIRFESIENVGTKFFFTVPLNENKS